MQYKVQTSDESRPSYISGRASNVQHDTIRTGTGTVPYVRLLSTVSFLEQKQYSIRYGTGGKLRQGNTPTRLKKMEKGNGKEFAVLKQ